MCGQPRQLLGFALTQTDRYLKPRHVRRPRRGESVTRVVPFGTVANVLRARRESDPGAPAVRCGGGWLTNAELDQASDRVAGGLRGLGVGKGDRVAFIL